MEDWNKNFWGILETTAVQLEQFFQDVGETVEAITDEFNEVFEAARQEWPDNVFLEMDRYIQDFFEPIVEISLHSEEFFFDDLGEDYPEDFEFFGTPFVEPTSENHSACLGCRHYHGRVYGGNLLICGMHPYGWDDSNCPDWEEKKPDFFDFDSEKF